MITSELYEQYTRNAYKLIFARGYTRGNADYREAKKPISKWKDQKNTKPLSEVQDWLKVRGWISAVLPPEVFALDIDNKEHYSYDGKKMSAENPQGLIWKMKMIDEIASDLKYGRHKTRNGYHLIFAADAAHSASSKVYTKCGMAVTYRPGDKTNLIVAPSDGREWERFVENADLDVLPRLLRPLDFEDPLEVRGAIAFQLNFFWRNGVLSGNDDIDFAFMDLLVKELGHDEAFIKVFYENIYGAEYDAEKTIYNYKHSLEKGDKERVITAASFYKRLHDAKLYDLIDLVNRLPRREGFEKSAEKKNGRGDNINSIAIEYAEKYAAYNKIISCGGALYKRNGWCYERFDERILRRHFGDWLEKRYKTKLIHEMVECVRDRNNIIVRPGFQEFLMADETIFNTHTLTTREPDENDYFFNRLNVKWDPFAECPRFLQFLREVFPDYSEDHIDFLQQFIGYIFFPQNRFEVSLILRGEGSNGKSVLMDVIEHIIGRANISSIGLGDLKNPMYIYQLQNKLLNMCAEVDHRLRMSDGIFKSLVSGENVTAKELYKNPTLIKPFCKFIYSSNNPISVSDKSDGYERRIVFLHFNVSFKGDKQDLDLRAKLFAEADGIFAWAIEGLQRIIKTGNLTVPRSLRDLSTKEHKRTNSVYTFCAEYLYWSAHGMDVVAAQKLFDEYKKYCAMNNLPAFSYEAFCRMVTANIPDLKKFKFKSQSISKFCNVRLKQVPYDSQNRCYNDTYEENLDPRHFQPVTNISFEDFQRRLNDENNTL